MEMTWREKEPGRRWAKTPKGKARLPRADLTYRDGKYSLVVQVKQRPGYPWRWRVVLDRFSDVDEEIERCIRLSENWRVE